MKKHEMVIPKVPLADWQRLHDAAARFRALEPWRDMEDNAYLGVTDPQTGQCYVGLVMGNLGEFFAFAMYREREGHDYCRQVQQMGMDWSTRPTVAMRQNYIMAEFAPKRDLDDTDLEVLKGITWKGSKRGPQSHVKFRNGRPSLFPWYLEAEEVRVLTLGFDAMSDYCLYHRGGGLLLTADANHLPAVELAGDPPRYRLVKWPTWPPLPEDVDESASYIERALQLRARRFRVHGGWQLANWPAFIPMASEIRPYFPQLALAVDEESYFILGQRLANPFEVKPGNFLVEILLECVEKNQTWPEEVQIYPARPNATLKSLCRQCGIPVRELDCLQTFETVYHDLDEHFQQQTPR